MATSCGFESHRPHQSPLCVRWGIAGITVTVHVNGRIYARHVRVAAQRARGLVPKGRHAVQKCGIAGQFNLDRHRDGLRLFSKPVVDWVT